MEKKQDNIKIIVNNKKANYNYTIENKYTCGMRIMGSEIKSIRNGDCSISEAFCVINDNELFIKNMFIKKYKYAIHTNHEELQDRKLLLYRKELDKISKKVSEKGYSIVPLKVLLKNGWAKIEIGIGKGKKLYNKRNSIKEKDIKRDIERNG